MDDITIPNRILFAFQSQLAGLAAGGVAAVTDEIVVVHDFGTDEATLDVAMDLAGRFHRRRPALDRPRPHLVFTTGQETDLVEQPVGAADEALARRFFQT